MSGDSWTDVRLSKAALEVAARRDFLASKELRILESAANFGKIHILVYSAQITFEDESMSGER